MPIPKEILNAPELLPGLELFYAAFNDLHTCRPVGMAEGQIPWTTIDLYCERYDITGDQREDFFYHIRELDHAYLEHKSGK